MNEIILKNIAQFRYVPTLAFYDNMFNVASTLEGGDEFEHWRAKRSPDAALLFSEKKRSGLNIDSRSITYTTEKLNTNTNMSSQLIKYSTLFLDNSNVATFNHVGMRRIGIYSTNITYDEYVDKFVNAFLNINSGLPGLIADKVEDTLYVIEGIKDGFMTRLRLAPLKQDQFESHYTPEIFTPKNLLLKKETNIIVDLDIFLQNESDNEAATTNLIAIEKSLEDSYNQLIELVKKETCR